MPAAIALIIAGFTLIYSALTGKSLADIVSGKALGALNPAGGKGGSGSVTPGGSPETDPGSGADPKGQFKGPNAAMLRRMADIAKSEYHLTIGQICRPQNATYGAPHSKHKECRAFDALGSVADRVAFARYAKGVCGTCEVFCDQAGMVAPGYEHTSHMHFGA